MRPVCSRRPVGKCTNRGRLSQNDATPHAQVDTPWADWIYNCRWLYRDRALHLVALRHVRFEWTKNRVNLMYTIGSKVSVQFGKSVWKGGTIRDNVASISYLSEDKADRKAGCTYLYLRVLYSKTSGTSTGNHRAPNVRFWSYINRLSSGFRRRPLDYGRLLVSAVDTPSSQTKWHENSSIKIAVYI